MTRIVAAAAAVLAATAVLAPARVADAHRPPPGRALEYRTELAGPAGQLMGGPRTRRPRAPAVARRRGARPRRAPPPPRPPGRRGGGSNSPPPPPSAGGGGVHS